MGRNQAKQAIEGAGNRHQRVAQAFAARRSLSHSHAKSLSRKKSDNRAHKKAAVNPIGITVDLTVPAFMEWCLHHYRGFMSCQHNHIHTLWDSFKHDWQHIPDAEHPPNTHRPWNLASTLKRLSVGREMHVFRSDVKFTRAKLSGAGLLKSNETLLQFIERARIDPTIMQNITTTPKTTTTSTTTTTTTTTTTDSTDKETRDQEAEAEKDDVVDDHNHEDDKDEEENESSKQVTEKETKDEKSSEIVTHKIRKSKQALEQKEKVPMPLRSSSASHRILKRRRHLVSVSSSSSSGNSSSSKSISNEEVAEQGTGDASKAENEEEEVLHDKQEVAKRRRRECRKSVKTLLKTNVFALLGT